MKTIATLSLCVLFCSALAWGQANVDESLETAQLWVDTNTGSDSNPGTQLLPLKTIGAAAGIAVDSNWLGIGTKVIINPGTYRESINVGTSGKATSLPITLEAATNGTVNISGADVWTGWQVYSGNSQVYTNYWPYQWGLCTPQSGTGGPPEPDIILRREMIIVNGTPLTQVLSLSQVIAPSMFYVDETNHVVYVWPPTGTNMSTATVEVATRAGLFGDAGLGNLVLRGLTFEYDSSCRDGGSAVVYYSANNVLLDTDSFVWNNSGGLSINGSTYVTVQNSVGNHNGSKGLDGNQTKYGLWQSNETSYNNWRGAQGAYYTWGGGGFHFFQMHDETVSGLTTIYNQTHGVHFDNDQMNLTVDSVVSTQNEGIQLFVEKSEGPVTVSNSTVCYGNPPLNQNHEPRGIGVNNSELVTMTGNAMVNTGTGMGISGTAGGFMVTNYETGQVYNLITENLTFTQNTAETDGTQYVFSDDLGGTDWTSFKTTLISDYNTWWNPSDTSAFSVAALTPPTTAFAGWKTLTAQDAHSVWQAPLVDPSGPCQLTADSTDYWLLVDNASLTVRPSTQAVFNLNLVPLGGFTGTVQLSSDGAQSIPDATAAWSQNPLTGSGTTTFTVTTGSATPAGTYNITLIANSGSLTHTVTVSVIVDTGVGLSTNSLTFGNQLVGTTSAAQTVTLTNNGTTALSITSIATSGTNQFDFGQTNTCGTSLPANATCTISVTFTPKASGARAADITITDSDPTSPQTVTLTGTGTAPIATLSTASLTFASQLVGTTSPAQTITLTNTGTATLTIDSINIYGDFGETTTCGATLGVGASCTFSVTFTPKTTGTLTGTLTLDTNSNPAFQKVTLTGAGIQPAVTLSPTTLNFGSQKVGTTSPAQTVTLTNTGTATLTITSVTTTKTDYKISSNTCGSTVSVGQSCKISTTFTPTAKGTRNGNLDVTDNASPSTQKVSLTGTGT